MGVSNSNSLDITIYGAGYVGLVTAACFAEIGHTVLCVDIDQGKVDQLNHGHCPIHEPGLVELIQRNLKTGRLSFSTDLQQGVAFGRYQFIAVGTPTSQDGSADVQAVLAVSQQIGQYITDYRVIVTKSTVPVGTSLKVQDTINHAIKLRNIEPIAFDIISNPEFLKEGAAVNDFMVPDRVVVGHASERGRLNMQQLYAPLIKTEPQRLLCMDIHSAELTKYAANAMLATKISFINEISQIAEKVGADIAEVYQGIALDERIGPHFINPGCGYGGSCFPKDVQALIHTGQQVGLDTYLINAAQAVNQSQKQILFNKIKQFFQGDLANRTIAVWGLSFKPNTDDIREAASRVLCEALWAEGASVQVYDPIAMDNFAKVYQERSDLKLYSSAKEALVGADVLAIVTEWDEFSKINLDIIQEKLKYPAIFDGRNIFSSHTLKEKGIQYFAIGRGDNHLLQNNDQLHKSKL